MEKPHLTKFMLMGSAILLVVVLLASPILTVEVMSDASHQFDVNARMTRVRKIMVRTNAVKKIVAMADATLLDQQWQNMGFESDRPLLEGEWHVNGQGKLSIKVNDSYLGQQDIQLSQKVDIRPERLYSTNDLIEPSESIKEYASTLELVPDGNGNSTIRSSLRLGIRTTASILTREIVKRKIQAAAKKSLESQEAAIRELVDEHAGKLFILPDFGRNESSSR